MTEPLKPPTKAELEKFASENCPPPDWESPAMMRKRKAEQEQAVTKRPPSSIVNKQCLSCGDNVAKEDCGWCKKCREAAAEQKRHEMAEREQQQRRREEEARRQEEQTRRERLAAIRKHLSFHLTTRGVPAILCDARFDQCQDLPRKAVEIARKWADHPEGSLVLAGPPGTGKTFLAVATLAEIIAAEEHDLTVCRFVSEATWLDSLRNEFGEIRIDRKPYAATILVYDDLGSAYMKDVRRGEVERLVRTRHAEQKPTIYTSNLSIQGIADVFGGRVASVLQEDRQIVKFGDVDLRLAGTIRPRRDRPAQPEGWEENPWD